MENSSEFQDFQGRELFTGKLAFLRFNEFLLYLRFLGSFKSIVYLGFLEHLGFLESQKSVKRQSYKDFENLSIVGRIFKISGSSRSSKSSES